LPYTPFNEAGFADTTNFKQSGGVPVSDFTRLNSLRTKAQHSLNLRIDKKWFLKKININLYLDLQNVYFSKFQTPPNLDVEFDSNNMPVLDPSDNSKYKLNYLDTSSGSIIPSIGFILEY
jgi:hypothetical protein